jgi:DNA polymerase elongation subunit (family B)
MLEKIRRYKEPLVIYAHNGGKFDFWYLSHAIQNPIMFIDSRLVKAKLFHHEIRDSYKILPVPLKSIQKDDIDYRKMECEVRDKHKEEISKYLRSDCVYLHDAVSKFIAQFGDVLTIGGAAMKEMGRYYDAENISPAADAIYREYFHGGRCEVFESGKVHSEKGFKLYDVNSLYPYCMQAFRHPTGEAQSIGAKLTRDPFYLAHVIADSKGALPVRTPDGLEFPHGRVESWCTSHEIRAAQKLGIVKIRKVIECHSWTQTIKFDLFVDAWNTAKIEAEKNGDKMGRTFGKLIMNNAFGKNAQNPENFKDWKIFESEKECENNGYEVESITNSVVIGKRDAVIHPRMYKNVAIAASVTGAGRAVWMQAFTKAVRPVYGDTDSLWCEQLNCEIDPHKLGAWKEEIGNEEGKITTLYIAGKKLYCAQNEKGKFYRKNGEPIKLASKGVAIKPEDIAKIACGKVLEIPIEAPSLRVGHEHKFIKRKIARTVKR